MSTPYGQDPNNPYGQNPQGVPGADPYGNGQSGSQPGAYGSQDPYGNAQSGSQPGAYGSQDPYGNAQSGSQPGAYGSQDPYGNGQYAAAPAPQYGQGGQGSPNGELPQYTPGDGASYTGVSYAGANPGSTAKNSLGVWALVCGIVGLVIGIASIPAIILGFLGVKAVNNGEANNKGMAITGIILGFLEIVLSILAIILIFVFGLFGFLAQGGGSDPVPTNDPSISSQPTENTSTSGSNGGSSAGAPGEGVEIVSGVEVAAAANTVRISDTASPETARGKDALLVEITVTNNSSSTYNPTYFTLSCETPSGATCERVFDSENDLLQIGLDDGPIAAGDNYTIRTAFFAEGDLNDIKVQVSDSNGGEVTFSS